MKFVYCKSDQSCFKNLEPKKGSNEKAFTWGFCVIDLIIWLYNIGNLYMVRSD